MAESFDFQINDLKFRAATSDRFPYARATAPFRKEQFDAAPTVGDQSLSGWWTRGQLSFHRGAGLKYYEVLDGEEVLNRFWLSSNIKFREPGEITLQELLEPLGDGSASISAVPGKVGSYLYWINGAYFPDRLQQVRVSDRAAMVPVDVTVASGEPTIVAANSNDDSTFFVATKANTIEVFTHGTPPTVSPNSYSHTAGLAGMWWAKNRLWILDANGDLFTVNGSPAVAGESLGAEVGSLGEPEPYATSYQYSAFAASPGGVYLANGSNKIWYVGVDESSSGGTLAWPTVVAELPLGGIPMAMIAHLGHLVIATSDGYVRVASVGADGSIVYGPPSLTLPSGPFGGFSPRQMSVADTSVFMAGPGLDRDAVNWDTIGYVYEINLAESVDDGLVFASAPVAEYTSGNSTYFSGVFNPSVTGWGFDLWHNTGGASSPGMVSGNPVPLATEGFVQTGFHRLGTLERKHFHSVTVRYGGEGVIEVWRVVPGEADVLAGSVTATGDGQQVIPLALPTPVESLALRFVLKRDTAYTGPTLLGYQIKALPSPVRQRLIKWPLMIQDVVRDRYGVSRGTREGAWTAWSELEALEESDALVTFTDHRTGETGEAFIESLELQTDTPTRGAESGFGGVGYITLRKVG